MFVFLVSDALLITLSWCIWGESRSWHLPLHVHVEFQLRGIKFKDSFYMSVCNMSLFLDVFSVGRFWRWGTPGNSHHAQPCRLVLPWPKLFNHYLFFTHYPVPIVHMIAPFPDSNNSGDNLYTMINTGPGNRNNVSSCSAFFSFCIKCGYCDHWVKYH